MLPVALQSAALGPLQQEMQMQQRGERTSLLCAGEKGRHSHSAPSEPGGD